MKWEVFVAKVNELIATKEIDGLQTALKREARLRARGDTKSADKWFQRIQGESSRIRPSRLRADEEEYRIGVLNKRGWWTRKNKGQFK